MRTAYGTVIDWLIWFDYILELFCAILNTMLRKYWNKLTKSARGEVFNPLIYPFLISTFSYGVGFLFFNNTADVGKASLYVSMHSILAVAPVVWGAAAIITILMGLYFLLFDKPPYGRYSGLLGFMVWIFASFCWVLTGAVLVFFAVGVPNLIFWFWQYLSLSRFRREDIEDKR